MRTRAIIQARMGSTRLRGKTLMPVRGIPLLYRVIEAVSRSGICDEITVATTDLPEDGPIEATVRHLGLAVHRGSVRNVLERFAGAAAGLDGDDAVVRFTADNPLNHPGLSRRAKGIFAEGGCDYGCIEGLSHVVPEFVRVGALRELAAGGKTDAYDEEHVTPYFRKHRGLYRTSILPPDFGGLRPDLEKYLTIDTQADLERFEALLGDVDPGPEPDFARIYAWLDARVPRDGEAR